ncbi:MAG TPA: DUF1656 domain-containing protein [Dongiaceae bacterium]|nr:DUF1656 domain-containing protein [Dongiaceae bacterium]
MIKEIDIGGVYITPFLACAIVALVINMVLMRVLTRIGFYRFVWHRYLFDAALFLILFTAVTFLMAQVKI